MPLAALVMALVVTSGLLPLTVLAIVWPGALARLNAAAIRTLPLAATQAQREQAASNSTPGMMRFIGIVGLGIMIVVVSNVIRTVLDQGLDEATPDASSWLAWPVYALGVAQALFGASLLLWSRQIFQRLRLKFEQAGADLDRWMIVVLGGLAVCMGATSLFVAGSLG